MRTRPSSYASYDWSDPATIAANRVGELTPDQRRLVGRPLNWGCLILASALMLACFAGPVLVAARNGDPSGFLYLAAPLVIILLLLSINRRSARERQEAAAGHLAQAPGQVVWRGRRYVAEIAGRRLRPLRHIAVPTPGPYRFFYLLRSGLLLSAEPLQGTLPHVPGLRPGPAERGFAEVLHSPRSPSQTQTAAGSGAQGVARHAAGEEGGEEADARPRLALLEALAHTLHFSPRDLVANRAGRLSAAQRRRLTFELVEERLGTFGGAAWLAALALGTLAAVGYYDGPALFPAQVDALRRQVGQQGVPLPLLLGGAIAVLAVLVTLGVVAASLATRQSVRDLRAGRVVAVEGVVHPETDMSGEQPSFYFALGALRFEVPSGAFAALIKARAYRLYYLPHSQVLLSMEPLSATAA